MTIEYVKDLLGRYGIKPSEKFGQNFLLDEIVLEDMVDAAGVHEDDTVIEIGPGIGNLTERLAKRAKHVIAIEKDVRMEPLLSALRKKYKNFEFFLGDGLTFDYSSVIASKPQRMPRSNLSHASEIASSLQSDATVAPRNDKKRLENTTTKELVRPSYRIAANIPYYITGKLVQLFLRLEPKPKSITLLVQKEVAQNIIAKPGSLGLLALSVQLYGIPRIVCTVPARSFYPAPKVDSAVVHIDIPEQSPFIVEDEQQLFKLLKACFMGKRKQIHNTLKNNLHIPEEVIARALAECNIPPSARPQQLTIPDWIALEKTLRGIKKD